MKTEDKILIGFVLICAALYFMPSTFGYPYSITHYVANNTASPINVYGLSMKSGEACSSKLTQILTSTGSSYSITTSLYSPNSVNIGTGTLTSQYNISCKNIASASSSSSLNGYFEGRSAITHGGATMSAVLNSQYACDSSGNYFNIEVYPWKDEDNYGDVPNRYYVSGSISIQNAINKAIATNYNYCDSELSPSPYVGSVHGGQFGVGATNAYSLYYYPFNSSQGYVNYSIAKFNGTNAILSWTENAAGVQSSGNATLILIDVADETASVIATTFVNSDNSGAIGGADQFWSGTLSLEKNKIYMFMLWLVYTDCFKSGPQTSSADIYEPSFNISAFTYVADWSCSDWSACEDGTQTQTCTDPLGIAPPEIKYQTCALNILENATLGFEEFVRDGDIYMCIPQWFFGCGYSINTTYRDSPANWTVIENMDLKRHFLGMTQDWSSEGSRSLKLWYIPPKMGEPTSNTTCGNQTMGLIPAVYQGESNDTFSVLYNVTFPAENMIVQFDVKGCSNQEHQHWGIRNPLAFWDNESYFCPPQCYAEDCTSVPLARYMFNIINVNTSASVIGTPYYGNADPDMTETIQIDMSNLGLLAGYTYNLVFAVYPENLQDERGDCVMIDNVKYYRLSEPYLTLLNGDCSSRCIGNVFYEAKLLSTGDCSVIRKEFAPECLSEEEAAHVEALEDYCDPESTSTLFHYNSRTAQYETVNCEYRCVDGNCITQEQAAAINVTQSLYAPPVVFQGFLNTMGVTEAEYGYVWFFLSVFMLVNYLAVTLGILAMAAPLMLSKSRSAHPSWEFGVIVIFMIIGSSFLGGFYPPEAGILICVGIGLLLYFFAGDKFTGKS